jgi:hypothetical protein
MREALHGWKFDRDGVRPAVAPTIPLHCNDEFLAGCATLAREYGVGLQTHLAESKVQVVAGLRGEQVMNKSRKVGGLGLKALHQLGDFDERDWFGYVYVENRPAVLPEDCAFRRLEDDVVLRIACGELLLYLFAEIVLTVFGFPKAMREPEFIDERAVNTQRVSAIPFDRPFGNQLPIKLPAAVLQQSLEGRANRSFVRHADRFELTQSFVIILDGLVGWFEVKLFHQQEEPGSHES